MENVNNADGLTHSRPSFTIVQIFDISMGKWSRFKICLISPWVNGVDLRYV